MIEEAIRPSMADRREPEPKTADPVEPLRQPSPAEVRAELERILVSQCFARAGRASDLLRFLVDQTLAGAGPRLKGYTIGVQVFGRPADFDAQADPLVRVEAGRLRGRLLEYYAAEGDSDPVRIEVPRGRYSVVCRYARPVDAAVAAPRRALPRRRDLLSTRGGAVALGTLLLAALGVIAWQQRAFVEADQALDVFERGGTEWPRLVVMPFENLSNEPRLDRLAASVTEELLVALAQRDLVVVATQTSWYRGGGGANRVTATETGGYVLTGSVRGGPEHARVTVRLIEAEGGRQLWTAGYDESLGNAALAELQARVARDVSLAAAPYGLIYDAELARAQRRQDAPGLGDCFARYYEYRRHIGVAAHREALRCFRSAAERKPQSVHARAGLAMLYVDEFAFRFTHDPAQSLAAARVATAEALAIDRDNYRANLALMWLGFFDGDPQLRQTIERTLALRPDSAEVLANAGAVLVIAGDTAAGLPLLERANARAKRPTRNYQLANAIAHLRAGRSEEALLAAQAIDTPDWISPHVIAAAAGGLSGHYDVARAAAQRILELDPAFETEVLGDIERWHFDREYAGQLLTGLRAAGLEIVDRRP